MLFEITNLFVFENVFTTLRILSLVGSGNPIPAGSLSTIAGGFFAGSGVGYCVDLFDVVCVVDVVGGEG